MTRTLSVWWDGVVVGTLQVNQHGQMPFIYASGWLADASCDLVLAAQTGAAVHPATVPAVLRGPSARGGAARCDRGCPVALAGRRGAASTGSDGYAAPTHRRRTARRAGHAAEAPAARRARGTATLPRRCADQIARRAGRRPCGPAGLGTADDAHSEAGHRAVPAHHGERGVGDDAGRSDRTAGGVRDRAERGGPAVPARHPRRPSVRCERAGVPPAPGRLLPGARHRA